MSLARAVLHYHGPHVELHVGAIENDSVAVRILCVSGPQQGARACPQRGGKSDNAEQCRHAVTVA